MDLFLQLTITGITNGVILALAALGFVLIYKSSDVINFAQGEFLLVGAYVIFAMVAQFGMHWTLGMALTILVAIGLGVLVERLVLRPMIGEPIISVIMVTMITEMIGSPIMGLSTRRSTMTPSRTEATRVSSIPRGHTSPNSTINP